MTRNPCHENRSRKQTSEKINEGQFEPNVFSIQTTYIFHISYIYINIDRQIHRTIDR